MKKYVKPELIFESFEMSQQIAACSIDGQFNVTDATDCSFTGYNEELEEPMNKIFSSEPTCKTTTESYCYHNSTSGGFGIFNS